MSTSLIGPGLSLLGSLFGGGAPAPQSRPLTAGEELTSLPQYLQNLYQQSSQFLSSQLGNAFPYPGQLQVGLSPLTQAAYSDIGALTGITPFAGGEMTADITGAYTDPTRNPIVQNMVAMLNNQYGPTSLNTQENLRTLHGNFNPMSAASGAQGYSGAASAEGALLGNLQAQLASQVAQLLQNVYNQERSIQVGEANQALNIPSSMATIGGVPTTLQQQNISSLYTDWLNQLKNMFGVPSAIFPSVASAFGGQTSLVYPKNALAEGITSFMNTPQFNSWLNSLTTPQSSSTSSPGFNMLPSDYINRAERIPPAVNEPPVVYPDTMYGGTP